MVLFVLVELMRCISHVIKFMVFLMRESPMDIATCEEDTHDLKNTRMSEYILTRDLVGRA